MISSLCHEGIISDVRRVDRKTDGRVEKKEAAPLRSEELHRAASGGHGIEESHSFSTTVFSRMTLI
jgi:hypothetical protein